MDMHLMDVVLFALKDISITHTHVWGTVEGGNLYDTQILLCSENLMAIYTFEKGTRVFFESARKAFGTIDFPGSNPRCNFDFWATKVECGGVKTVLGGTILMVWNIRLLKKLTLV